MGKVQVIQKRNLDEKAYARFATETGLKIDFNKKMAQFAAHFDTSIYHLSEVVIEGIAYPNRSVTLLKDGQVASQANSDASGRFRFSLVGISSGVYTFGVVSTDSTGNKSLTYTFTFRVAPGVNTSVTGIVLPPTVSIDKLEVRQGEPVNFIGYSYPDSNVFLSINSLYEIVKKAKADKDGFWTFAFNTLEVEKGNHSVSANASGKAGESSSSDKVYFKVGDTTVLADKPKVIMGDSNADNKVNLIDFSIMAYWYKRTLTTSSEKIVDLNGDKRVTLVDFSILAYYWTG